MPEDKNKLEYKDYGQGWKITIFVDFFFFLLKYGLDCIWGNWEDFLYVQKLKKNIGK